MDGDEDRKNSRWDFDFLNFFFFFFVFCMFFFTFPHKRDLFQKCNLVEQFIEKKTCKFLFFKRLSQIYTRSLYKKNDLFTLWKKIYIYIKKCNNIIL